METSSDVPPEIWDGIRDTFGRKGIVTMRKMVKLLDPETSNYNPKVLLLTPYRCQLANIRSPFKVEVDFHFLNINSLDSHNRDYLMITLKNNKVHTMTMIGSDDSDQIIGRIALSCRTIFPGILLSRILRASLEPVSRQKMVQNILHQADQMDEGPCGNFSEQYRCICDYLDCPVREEVQWDVDTIYLTQSCREINLKDFDLTDSRDLAPIIAVMVYNRWFEKLVVRNRKLSSELIDLILKVIRNSMNLKELVMDGVGVKNDFVQRLARNMMENKECCLEKLDLSNNAIDDKGAIFLSGPLPMLKPGSLKQLVLSHTGLTSKGLNGLCQALRSNNNVVMSLTHLDFSYNSFKSEEVEGLYSLLSNENCIQDINLTSTNSAIEVYISAFSKGCLKHLRHANLSKNHFFSKSSLQLVRYPHFLEEDFAEIRKTKTSELPHSFQQFFEDTSALQCMNMSEVKLPPEALRAMLTGLSSNMDQKIKLKLILSDCELKTAGCRVLQIFVGSLKNVKSLDISGNSLDEDLIDLLPCLQMNGTLKELMIGRNFTGIKSKNMREVMEAIVELVQEEDSRLEALSLADSKTREFLHMVLGCVGSNTSLRKLDISGNMIGDGGARVLAKSLQINAKLQTIVLDKNSLTAVGYREIASALEKNYTLRYMPYPVQDVVGSLKQHPEKTQTSLARIQDLLLRNANANQDSSEQQFRLRRALTSTGQIVLDKVAEKTEDTINALEMFGMSEFDDSDVVIEIVSRARNLVKDARSSRDLLSEVYGLGMKKTEGSNSDLQRKINEMACSVDEMVDRHIEDTIDLMISCAEDHCPNIYQGLKDELSSQLSMKCKLPGDLVKDHVITSSGAEITNKVGNLNLTIATLISNKLTDTLLAELSQCNLSLTEHLNKSKQQNQFRSFDLSKLSPVQSPTRDYPPDDDVTTGVSHDLQPQAQDMMRVRAESVARRQRRPAGKKQQQDRDSLEDTGSEASAKHPVEDEGEKKTDIDVTVSDVIVVKSEKRRRTRREKKVEKKEKEEEKVAPEPEPKPEPKPESKPEPKSEPKTEPITEPKPETKPEPKPEAVVPVEAATKSGGEEDATGSRPAEAEVVAEVATEVVTEEFPLPPPVDDDTNSLDDEDLPPPPEDLGDEKTTGSIDDVIQTDDVDGEKKEVEVEVEVKKNESDDVLEALEFAPQSRLQHLTKGRARCPNRKVSRRSTRRAVKPVVTSSNPTNSDDVAVDDFFTKDVSSTDFSNVPNMEEEAKLKEAEAEKKPKRIPGGVPMGGMMLTPGMLKLKTRPAGGVRLPSNEDADDKKDSDSPNHQAESKPAVRRPPAGGMPMGFLAELKTKNQRV